MNRTVLSFSALLTPTLFLALLLAGCTEVTEYKPPAVGQGGEIMVVTDSATWSGPVGEALRATLDESRRARRKRAVADVSV